MFLILCVPFLQTNSFPFARVLVVLIILAMNELVLHPVLGPVGLGLVLAGKLGLFVAFAAHLIALAIASFERRADARPLGEHRPTRCPSTTPH